MNTSPITLASLCSGIGGAELGFADLGFEPQFFAEFAPFPSAVLDHHWPQVPNLGDLNLICGRSWANQIDVLWASFPCQDFSEAGKQAGLRGARGALTMSGLRVVDEIDPKVFCFENVPQLLSLKENPFGQFLGALAGEFGALLPPGDRWPDAGRVLGPRRAIAWRVLDAKHVGCPQQRRRLYVIGCPRSTGIDPAALLHEGHPPLNSPAERRLRGEDAFSLPQGSAFAAAVRGRSLNGFYGQQIEIGGPFSNCLRASQGGSDKPLVLQSRVLDGKADWALRDLTPREAERCMGLPDDHTLIPGASDSARYHAIGNSLPVPVVRWIAERIQKALRP